MRRHVRGQAVVQPADSSVMPLADPACACGQAYRGVGRTEESYMDLQEVSQACPDHQGILDKLQQAAQLCLTRRSRRAGCEAWQVCTSKRAHEPFACLNDMLRIPVAIGLWIVQVKDAAPALTCAQRCFFRT